MINLTHPVTGHEVKTDEASADFWQAAGFRASDTDTKKASAKKSTSSKSKK